MVVVLYMASLILELICMYIKIPVHFYQSKVQHTKNVATEGCILQLESHNISLKSSQR